MDGERFVESKDGIDGMRYLEKLFSEKQKKVHTTFCDILLEIDIKEDFYHGYVFSENKSYCVEQKTGSYSEMLGGFCKKYCNREDEKEVFEKLSITSLVRDCAEIGKRKVIRQFYLSKVSLWIEACAYTLEREGKKHLILLMSDVTRDKDLEEKTREYVKSTIHALDAANKSRSDFMERLSHDFRSPVESNLSLLKKARENIHHPIILENCLKKMEDTSRYMMSLIEDIRDISCLEGGRTVLERESFNLMELIDNLTRRIKKQANDKLLGFTVEEKGRLFRDYYMIGDAKRFCQILENILSNAIKYTPSGGQIMFSYGEIRESAGLVDMEFSVQDNGVGISKEYMKHIFEPFGVNKRDPQSGFDAKGLSLTISKRLVQLMNGEITVESAKGEGSCFTVRITMEKGLPIEKGVSIKSEETKETENKNERCVLVADTNLLDAETVVTYLEMNGYNVEKATRGGDVIEKFSQAPAGYYQALILDESMPIKSGSSLAKDIRIIERDAPDKSSPPVPIILMTKKAIPLEQELFKSGIINGVLQKPLDSDRLLGTMSKCISG